MHCRVISTLLAFWTVVCYNKHLATQHRKHTMQAQAQQLFNLVNATGDILQHCGRDVYTFSSVEDMQAQDYVGLISFVSAAHALEHAKRLNITFEVNAIECTV